MTGLPRWARLTATALLVVAVVSLPLNASPFVNLQLSIVLATAVALLGLDVLTGWTGQVSLGQSAFYGIGAYAVAVCTARGWPLLVGLAVTVLIAGLVGAIIAIPAVRLRGYALSMVTLALPVVAVPLAKRLDGLTGGSPGLATRTVSAPEWSGLDNDQWRFLVIALISAAVFLLVRNVLKGRHGRALATIRSSEVLATAMGIPVQRYKVGAFVVAAACGGVGGGLYVVAVQFISPETLIVTFSISLLAVLVIGGLRSTLGPLLGAAFYVLVPNVTGAVDAGQSYLLYGLCVLLVMFLLPGGLASAVHRVLAGAARVLPGSRPAVPDLPSQHPIPAPPLPEREVR
ncbi:branched-chain amino acid ABC transporter permease [Modestobacter lapidis]|nr:branched-chain amino acid ABC transporter permease [Modestobacter lapidis]